MSIDRISQLELELYKLKDRLANFCLDNGPNGSSYPFRNEATKIDEMIKFLERYQ